MIKKSKKIDGLGEILKPFLSSLGLERRLEEQKVLDAWQKAVGEVIAEKTFPMRMRNGVLYVIVTNSVWLQELHFMKGLILQKLQRLVGDSHLQDLRFNLGAIDPPAADREGKNIKRVIGEENLNKEEQDRVEQAIAGISNQEMRESLRRIYSKALAADKFRTKG